MTELAPHGLPQRLREGIDPHEGIAEAEAVMDAAADELDRLRAQIEYWQKANAVLCEQQDRLRAEVAELKSENIKLETRAQDAENDLHNARSEVEGLKNALLDFGQHQHSCRKHTYPLLEPKECDCGWSAAVAKHLRPPAPPGKEE